MHLISICVMRRRPHRKSPILPPPCFTQTRACPSLSRHSPPKEDMYLTARCLLSCVNFVRKLLIICSTPMAAPHVANLVTAVLYANMGMSLADSSLAAEVDMYLTARCLLSCVNFARKLLAICTCVHGISKACFL